MFSALAPVISLLLEKFPEFDESGWCPVDFADSNSNKRKYLTSNIHFALTFLTHVEQKRIIPEELFYRDLSAI